MVTKNKIIDYCCETPGNTNKMVLDSLLEDFGGSDKPTGTIEITENGSTDVTKYATANVNVSGGGGEPIRTIIYEADPSMARPSRGYKIEIDDTYDYLEVKYLYNNSDDVIETALANPLYVYIPLKNRNFDKYGLSTNYYLMGNYTNTTEYCFRRCFITQSQPLEELPAYFKDDSKLIINETTDSHAAIPIKLTLIKY